MSIWCRGKCLLMYSWCCDVILMAWQHSPMHDTVILFSAIVQCRPIYYICRPDWLFYTISLQYTYTWHDTSTWNVLRFQTIQLSIFDNCQIFSPPILFILHGLSSQVSSVNIILLSLSQTSQYFTHDYNRNLY